MATSAIVTTWGASMDGREQMGLGVFMGAVQFFTERKQSGDIEDLRIYIANEGSLSEVSGHMIVEGTDDQIDALAKRDDYRKLITKAAHVVYGLRTASYSTGTAVMGRIEMLQLARKELGI